MQCVTTVTDSKCLGIGSFICSYCCYSLRATTYFSGHVHLVDQVIFGSALSQLRRLCVTSGTKRSSTWMTSKNTISRIGSSLFRILLICDLFWTSTTCLALSGRWHLKVQLGLYEQYRRLCICTEVCMTETSFGETSIYDINLFSCKYRSHEIILEWLN